MDKELIQVLLALLILGVPALAQLLGRKKRGAQRQTPRRPRPAAPLGEEDIAERVKRMLAEAAGREQPPARPKPQPKPRPQIPSPFPAALEPTSEQNRPGHSEPRPAGFSVALGDQEAEAGMGDKMVFANLGVRTERAVSRLGRKAAKPLTSRQVRSLFFSTPQAAVIGMEVLGPPRALREYGEERP